MAISITQLLGTDNVALSRLTINANFNALKAGYDAMATLLNPDLSSLNVKSIQVDNTASSLSATIFSVSKGASILGNLTVGTTGQATTVTVNGTGGVNISNASLILTNGNLALSNAASLFSTAGNLSVSSYSTILCYRYWCSRTGTRNFSRSWTIWPFIYYNYKLQRHNRGYYLPC